MATWPASMQLATLTADFRRWESGDSLDAVVYISSPSALVSQTDDVIVPRLEERVTTSAGLLSVVLPVNNDAEWLPNGQLYLVRAVFLTGRKMAWLVDFAGDGSPDQTYDLADLGVEIPYPDSLSPFVVVYPLPPDSGGGGGGAVDSVFGRVGVVTAQANDYSVAQINGLTSQLSGKASTTHAATHASAGADPVTLAQSQISGLTSALSAKADLVGGVLPTSQLPPLAVTSYLGTSANQAAMLAKTGQEGDWTIRTDLGTVWWITGADPTILGNWTQAAYPTAPVISVNTQTGAVVLAAADVGAVPTARTISAGTGLTGGGDLTANRSLAVAFGTSGSTAAVGNDARLSDARTPIAHAATHASAGSDPITIAQSQVTGLVAALAAAAPQKDPNAAVYGLKLAILDPFETQSTALNLNNGALLLMRKWVPENMALTKLGTWMRTAGVTNVGFSGIALYDAAGTLLDKTGDMSAQFATANAYVEGTIASTINLVANTAVYFAILAQFSGTNPQISGRPSSSLIAINGLRASVFINGTTSFPASVDINAASLNDAAYYLTAR